MARPAQHAEIELLQAAIQSEVQYELNPSGVVRYLAAANIAPSCGAGSVVTRADAETLLTCFFDSYPELFSDGAEDTRLVGWTMTRLGASAPNDRHPHDHHVARLHQT